MSRIAIRWFSLSFFVLAGLCAARDARADTVVNVPPLSSAGSTTGFQFVSFQFIVSVSRLVGPGYAANVVGNAYENYTYLLIPPGIRTPGSTHSEAYTTVSAKPTKIDAFFVFSGADVAGQSLKATVQNDDDPYTLTLFNAQNAPVPVESVLSNEPYTLKFTTSYLGGSQVLLQETTPPPPSVPEPPTYALIVIPVIAALAVYGRRWNQRVLSR